MIHEYSNRISNNFLKYTNNWAHLRSLVLNILIQNLSLISSSVLSMYTAVIGVFFWQAFDVSVVVSLYLCRKRCQTYDMKIKIKTQCVKCKSTSIFFVFKWNTKTRRYILSFIFSFKSKSMQIQDRNLEQNNARKKCVRCFVVFVFFFLYFVSEWLINR